jgi:hypothetical protein
VAVGERAAPKPAGHRPADIASSAICVVTAVVVDAPDPEAALGDSSAVAEVAAAVAAATAAADSLTAAGALMSLCDVSNLSSPRYV